MVDANSVMNAAYAEFWGGMLGDKRFVIPFKALGYGTKADKLLAVLREVSDEPTADRTLIELWAELIGLKGSFHFSPLSLI